MEFIEIQRRLVDALLKIPAMETLAGRTSLLDGLPDAGLVRDQNITRLDLNRIIGGLERMGRLTKQGGIRPVIVVVDNALGYVPEGSEIAENLHGIRHDLENYYGGEAQPELEPAPAEVYEALIFGQQRDTCQFGCHPFRHPGIPPCPSHPDLSSCWLSPIPSSPTGRACTTSKRKPMMPTPSLRRSG